MVATVAVHLGREGMCMPRFSLLVAVLAATVTLALGTCRVMAQDASPVASPVAVAALIADFVAALNAHDPNRVAALYTDDAVAEQMVRGGGVFRSREEIAGLIAANLEGVPDLTVTTESAIVEGDRIAWEWVYHGTYTGQYPGLPAGRGQPIELHGVSLLELRNGQIVREWLYFDNDDFMAQVGAQSASSTPAAGTPAP